MPTGIDTLKMNSQAETNGVWATFPGTDIELLVARLWNKRMSLEYVKMLREAPKDATVDPDEQPALGQLLARTVLLDWRNVTANDEQLPYTVDVGEKYLCNPDYHELTTFISRTANQRDMYLCESAEARKGK